MAIFLSWPVVVYESIALVVTRNHYTIGNLLIYIYIICRYNIWNYHDPLYNAYNQPISAKDRWLF